MKKVILPVLLIFITLFFNHCKSNLQPENLLTALPHIEDSIIYEIPPAPRLCDAMDVEKLYIDVGDCKLYCEIEGEGIPMILIHGGLGGTHHCFHPWLSGAKNNFKIIYYDQRGCGLSDYNEGEGYSFEQTVEDLENLRKALKIDKWILLGHSYGGAIAQYYTIKYPKNVLGQILVGSVSMINNPGIEATNQHHFKSEQEIEKLNEILNLMMAGKLTYAQYFYNSDINGGWKRQNFLKPTKERHSQLALYDILFDPNINSDYKSYDFKNAFENCPIPTLICEGKYDSTWSAIKVPMLVKNHPNAVFQLIEKSSHNIYSDQPEEFIHVIENWSKSLKAANNKEIDDWKNYTNDLLGSQIDLINNNKDFIRLIRDEGTAAAKLFYEDFKINNPDKVLFFENSLINLGYSYLRNDKIEEAISLFELNIKEFPESWNAYDSLAEAYLKAGNKKLAIEYYKKSVELNPENTNAQKIIDEEI